MKQFNKYIFLLIVFAGFARLSGYSQDSLSYYLEQAAQNNPRVNARYLEYSAALEKVPQAGSLPDPQVQFGYFIKPMELLGGNEVANVSLMQMFPWFGTLKAAKDEASKMALAKYENFRDTKEQLYFDVKSSYYKVYRSIKEIEIAKKNLEILHSIEQLALIKFRAGGTGNSSGGVSSVSSGINASSLGSSGMGNNDMSNQGNMGQSSRTTLSGTSTMSSSGGSMGSSMGGNGKDDMVNLLRVQIETHELENRIALLEEQLKTDKLSFNRFLNRPSITEVFTGDTLIQATLPLNNLSLADSLINHPMVKMYEAEAEANEAKLQMMKKMGYPMLGLGLNYMVIQKRDGNAAMMNGKDMAMPMVSLTLPIYRKKYKSLRNEAQFLREAASLSALDVNNNLRVNFQQTMQNLNDADRRVKLYTDQVLLADKSVQLLIASFSSGGANLVEVLRMQQQLLDYQFKQVEAIVDKNTSIAEIVYLTGDN